MLTSRRVIKCIQLQDWFSVIDLKDAYFHVSILLRHRRSYDLRLRGPLEQVYRHTVVTTGALHATGRQPRALDGAPTALAYQLPTAVDSASSLTAVPATAVGQARASPHGQHCGCLMHQPVGRYTITPHVTARPPSPPLESHAVQVTARCPHPGEAQSCGRRALTTAQVPWRMMTPFRDDPADLESIWGSSDRPVCCIWVLPLPAVFFPEWGLPLHGLTGTAAMRLPQWAYSHRHCASSGRTRSRSCWSRRTGPPRPGFPNSFPALALLCPVRALRIYVDRTRSFRSSEQLFVCHRGQQKGKIVSKQRLAHWIVEAVTLAYQSQGEPCPLGVRAHPRGLLLCLLLCVGAWRLSGEHLQSCGLGDTEHLRKILQSLPACWVTGNGREELVGVTLAAPFPLTRGYKCLFLLIPLRVIPYVYSSMVRFPSW